MKKAVAKSQFLRALRVSSDNSGARRSTDKINELFLANGYPTRALFHQVNISLNIFHSKYSSNTVLYDQGNMSSRYSYSGSSIGRALARAVTEPVVASSSLVVVALLSAGDNSPTDPLFSVLFAKSDARRRVLFTAEVNLHWREFTWWDKELLLILTFSSTEIRKNLIIIKTQFTTNIFRFFVFLSRKMSI